MATIYLHPTACRLHILRQLENRTEHTVVFRGSVAVLVPGQRKHRAAPTTPDYLPEAG